MKTFDQTRDEYCQSHGFRDFQHYSDALTLSDGEYQEIAEMYAQQFRQEWIPVSERLPEEGNRVIVFYEDGYCQCSDFVNNTFQITYSIFGNITHWAPLLPSPPKS